ncbi:tripartite tricarboxylate transporter permease [Natranaerofaba carboxydovora]|uniref:tripartite tricarboxylate transporter permease n=1 Tax=Natranaerofaba carboxydovora TaxID=2742683 RepID=UPI001F142FCF|nr:tripartite tricarboxylate transporter permease [Natranaerofaba carboxydovora]UMZ74689.1 Tripartite tricarboxylate transporter TctA family protein [Natranaerofaba carboxydovora]
MEPMLIIQMVLVAIIASALYLAIGIAPGTDETAVIAPVGLALALAGIEPMLLLTFFMASIVAKKITDSVPVAVAGIPGGVMSAPMVEHGVTLKEAGRANHSIRKMASGSIIGTLVSVPLSLVLASLLEPLAPFIEQYADIVFFVGAIFLSLMAKEKLMCLLSIIPLAVTIQALRSFYVGLGAIDEDVVIFTSFFLGITIGPMIVNLLELANSNDREAMKGTRKKISLIKDKLEEKMKFPLPYKVLNAKEGLFSAISAVVGTVFFFMTPVGMTSFVGEAVSSNVKDKVERAGRAISSMDALTNATYVAGLLVPLIAVGLPVSPMAIGPANPLFNAPPRFSPEENIHHLLSFGEIALATILAVVIAMIIVYPITVRYSTKICELVFKKIPHESLLALFFGLVITLAYMDAGVIGIFGTLLFALVAGYFNKKGVNFGVQFMILYCAPWLIGIFSI